MTLVEQEQLDAQARNRRIKREEVESQITAAEQRLTSLDKEIAEKEKLLTELGKLDAMAAKLPSQIAAKRAAIGGGGGPHSSTIPCLQTELRSSLAGALQVQTARLETLTTRRQAEAKQLEQLREGVKEFAA
jgi:hypothetical protein